MSLAVTAILLATMVGTSFLSGIFGMAGGLILVGVLLAILPLPAAMMLHGVTQLASNLWRASLWWRHIRWKPVAAYIAGCTVALLGWSLFRYVPATPVALLMLGVTPFMVRLAPAKLRANPDSPGQGVFYGVICMTLILLTGVAGPLIDSFFLGGNLDRREIVATKSGCQVFGHAAKLIYFGGIIDQAASVDPILAGLAIVASMVGTSLAARVLEAMSDLQFRRWANRIITTIATYYILDGSYMIIWPAA
jgi:uncharacterized membrane protein YfcA